MATAHEELQGELSRSFTQSVKSAMNAAGVNQSQIATPMLGVSHVAFGNRLSGVASWKLQDVEAVATFFGVSPIAMLQGPGSWWKSIDAEAVRARLRAVSDNARYPAQGAAIAPPTAPYAGVM